MNRHTAQAAAVLVSGGLDSAILTVDLVREFARVVPIYVRSGLRWEDAELAALRRFLSAVARDRRLGHSPEPPKQLRTPMAVEDFLKNPDLLKGKSPAEIEALLGKTPGWRIETLGKGGHDGQGWVLREYTSVGNPTGRMLRWHPGDGHHGLRPYWRVTGVAGGKSGIIR